jgi:hypothetical protein
MNAKFLTKDISSFIFLLHDVSAIKIKGVAKNRRFVARGRLPPYVQN